MSSNVNVIIMSFKYILLIHVLYNILLTLMSFIIYGAIVMPIMFSRAFGKLVGE